MIVSQRELIMQPNLLILGGTNEATSLAKIIAKHQIKAIVSYAGRVERIAELPVPKRIGGFGGVDGLKAYIRAEQITHIIDATHPFAAQMSWNAAHACKALNIPLLALTRPAWQAQPGDRWQYVPDMDGAVRALDGAARRVMLAIGRMHLAAFTPHQQHFYLLRLVDPPEIAPAFRDYHTVISRGPFTTEDDVKLLKTHEIDVIIAKNAGGRGAVAKIDAARALGIDVIMIDRPELPERAECQTVEDVLMWLHNH